MPVLHDNWSYQILKSYDSLKLEKRSAGEYRICSINLLLSVNSGLENAISLVILIINNVALVLFAHTSSYQ